MGTLRYEFDTRIADSFEQTVEKVTTHDGRRASPNAAPFALNPGTEAELLRAIADTLDCPIPPLVDPAESQATGDAP